MADIYSTWLIYSRLWRLCDKAAINTFWIRVSVKGHISRFQTFESASWTSHYETIQGFVSWLCHRLSSQLLCFLSGCLNSNKHWIRLDRIEYWSKFLFCGGFWIYFKFNYSCQFLFGIQWFIEPGQFITVGVFLPKIFSSYQLSTPCVFRCN